jgi:hypothetical protein
MAAYRLVPGQHRQPVIAELRVFPREQMKGRPPGRWGAEVLGIEVTVPEGGISAELVRRVRIGEHRQVGREFSRWLREQVQSTPPTIAHEEIAPALASLHGRTLTASVLDEPASAPKRGRPPIRSEEFYAKLARDYTERVAQGSPRPTADIARRRNLPQSKVRDMLHEARRLGLLSSTSRGRSGGGLTPKAVAILNAGKTG